MKGYFDSKFQELLSLSSDGNYAVAYAYDEAGRIITETVTGDISRVITYSYDPSDNIEKEVIAFDGKTITKTYTYDESNNITNIAVVTI